MILFFEDRQVRCRMSDGGRPPEVSVQTRASNRPGAAVDQKTMVVSNSGKRRSRWLKVWLEHADITKGPVFRRLIGQTQVGGALNPGSIAPIFKRVAQWIGMPQRVVNHVSGNSTRMGATQDLTALDIDLAAITQAGGWKSPRMPLQYAEKIVASRSGMALAAAATGRDARSDQAIAAVEG